MGDTTCTRSGEYLQKSPRRIPIQPPVRPALGTLPDVAKAPAEGTTLHVESQNASHDVMRPPSRELAEHLEGLLRDGADLISRPALGFSAAAVRFSCAAVASHHIHGLKYGRNVELLACAQVIELLAALVPHADLVGLPRTPRTKRHPHPDFHTSLAEGVLQRQRAADIRDPPQQVQPPRRSRDPLQVDLAPFPTHRELPRLHEGGECPPSAVPPGAPRDPGVPQG